MDGWGKKPSWMQAWAPLLDSPETELSMVVFIFDPRAPKASCEKVTGEPRHYAWLPPILYLRFICLPVSSNWCLLTLLDCSFHCRKVFLVLLLFCSFCITIDCSMKVSVRWHISLFNLNMQLFAFLLFPFAWDMFSLCSSSWPSCGQMKKICLNESWMSPCSSSVLFFFF